MVIAGAARCVARDTVVRALNALPFRGVFFSLFPSEWLEGFLFNRNSRFLHGGVCVCHELQSSSKARPPPCNRKRVQLHHDFCCLGFVVAGFCGKVWDAPATVLPATECIESGKRVTKQL